LGVDASSHLGYSDGFMAGYLCQNLKILHFKTTQLIVCQLYFKKAFLKVDTINTKKQTECKILMATGESAFLQ
jgi:hypothetical protein